MAKNLVDGKASLDVRALSRMLSGWRGHAGLSLSELEARTGFSTAKLSSLCSAHLRPSTLDVMKIGYACAADDQEVDLCIRAAQRAHDPETWDRINGKAWQLPTWTYWDVAAEAAELVIVATNVLPELVRTPALQEAMFSAGAAAHELTRELKNTLLARLAVEPDDAACRGRPSPLRVRLIVCEPALAGGSRLMADQLRHLEELTWLPGLEFFLVDNGPRYFGMGTSFTMMRFVERRFDDVVHHRALHGDSWLETATERALYELALDSVAKAARGQEQSTLRLGLTAAELEAQPSPVLDLKLLDAVQPPRPQPPRIA